MVERPLQIMYPAMLRSFDYICGHNRRPCFGNKSMNNLWNGVFVYVDSIVVYLDTNVAVLHGLVPEFHVSSFL